MRQSYLRIAAVAALAVFALVAAGCSGGDGSPAATPPQQDTPTVIVVPGFTPTPGVSETNDYAGLKAYAEAVDTYLQKGEMGILTSRLVPALTGGNWRSEAGPIQAQIAAAEVMAFATNARPDLRDQYGDGAPKVWGFGNTPENAHIVVTAITRRNGGSAGAVRAAIDFELTYCAENCPTKNDRNRWTITRMVSAYVLAEDWLFPGTEGRAFLGTQYEVFHRPLKPTSEIFEAARNVAAAFGTGVKAMPECVDNAGCISTVDAGPSVDLGVMRLGFRAPVGEGGGAAVFAGKGPDGTWGFWFGTQQGIYRAVDLPGDILVCSGADALNVRQAPSMSAAIVSSLKDGDRVRAEQFVLTEPGSLIPGGANGAGWYRVSANTLPAGGWVYSKFTTDARLGSCELRNAIEG